MASRTSYTLRIACTGVASSYWLGRRRWTVVERTVSRLAGCRRLHRRYERKAEHFLGFAGNAVPLINDRVRPGDGTVCVRGVGHGRCGDEVPGTEVGGTHLAGELMLTEARRVLAQTKRTLSVAQQSVGGALGTLKGGFSGVAVLDGALPRDLARFHRGIRVRRSG